MSVNESDFNIRKCCECLFSFVWKYSVKTITKISNKGNKQINREKMSSTKSKTIKPPQPPKPVNLNLNMKLNRFVYTKYRAMLGSYNDKANEIIQSLPTTKKAILQQMDRRRLSLVTMTIKKSPWVLHTVDNKKNVWPRMEWRKCDKQQQKICWENNFGVLWLDSMNW